MKFTRDSGKEITFMFLVMITIVVLFFATKKNEQNKTLAVPLSNKIVKKEEVKKRPAYTGTYGMFATFANGETRGSIDWLVEFLNKYPNITSEEMKEFKATTNSLQTRVETLDNVEPTNLNAWWHSTYFSLTKVVKNQSNLTSSIDFAKMQSDPLYRKEIITQMEKNKEYLRFNSDLINKFIMLEYPDIYSKYPEDAIVGATFVGLPEMEIRPHLPYFGIPIDIDRDNELEMVFYTTKFMNKTPHFAYIVKDDVIIFQSPKGARVSLIELEDPKENGFYFIEDNIDLKKDDKDRIYTKYSYTDGIISKVSTEVRSE